MPSVKRCMHKGIGATLIQVNRIDNLDGVCVCAGIKAHTHAQTHTPDRWTVLGMI